MLESLGGTAHSDKDKANCESSLRSCSGAGCHWLPFLGAGEHLLCPCPLWGQQWFAFQEEINWLHLAETEVCETDVCFFVVFFIFSPELLDKNSSWKCRSFISNTDIRKLFLSSSSSLPYSCFTQTQPKWPSDPAGAQPALVLWVLVALQVTEHITGADHCTSSVAHRRTCENHEPSGT